MKNVTTHETSAALKAAGFPQREPEAGQFWYDDSGVLVCIGFSYDPGGSIARFKQTFAFAPTAADILRELGGQYYLSIENGGAAVMCEVSDDWSEDIKQAVFTVRTVVFNTDPAEACALAWLEMKKEQDGSTKS